MIDFPLCFTGIPQMSLFLNYLWIWIVLAFVAGVCGGAWYLNDQKGRTLVIAIAAPVLTLILGLALYYGVDTDHKSVVRMLDALIAAVERDDLNAVCQFLSPKADTVRQIAETGMAMVTVSRAKYHHLEIEINDAASPPIAKVQFTAVFYWNNKEPVDGISLDQPIPDNARFEFELVKTKSPSNSPTWLITNKFDYRFRHLP